VWSRAVTEIGTNELEVQPSAASRRNVTSVSCQPFQRGIHGHALA
jgi:hypothetical protein